MTDWQQGLKALSFWILVCAMLTASSWTSEAQPSYYEMYRQPQPRHYEMIWIGGGVVGAWVVYHGIKHWSPDQPMRSVPPPPSPESYQKWGCKATRFDPVRKAFLGDFPERFAASKVQAWTLAGVDCHRAGLAINVSCLITCRSVGR